MFCVQTELQISAYRRGGRGGLRAEFRRITQGWGARRMASDNLSVTRKRSLKLGSDGRSRGPATCGEAKQRVDVEVFGCVARRSASTNDHGESEVASAGFERAFGGCRWPVTWTEVGEGFAGGDSTLWPSSSSIARSGVGDPSHPTHRSTGDVGGIAEFDRLDRDDLWLRGGPGDVRGPRHHLTPHHLTPHLRTSPPRIRGRSSRVKVNGGPAQRPAESTPSTSSS